MFGVYVGVYFKDSVDAILQKKLLVAFYLLVVLYLIVRIFF